MPQPTLAQILDAGMTLCRQNRFADAERLFRNATARFGENPIILNNLASILALQKKLDEAMAWHDRAISAEPTHALSHANRGKTLMSLQRFDEALESFRRVIELEPNNAGATGDLGVCLRRLNRDEESAKYFRRAIELSPQTASNHAYLGQVLWDLGQPNESLQSLRRAVELGPGDPKLHHALGMGLLLMSDLPNGWRELDYRWQTSDYAAIASPTSTPRWDGSPLKGRTIYIQPEQGLGDTLHFIRYAALLADNGGRVAVGTHRPLKELVATAPGVSAVAAEDEPLPPHDCWVGLMSLAKFFATDLSDIPANVPYIRADAAKVARWKERLANDSNFKVGLTWAGNPEHTRDRLRSMRLNDFAPMTKVHGVTFYSLQRGAGAEQAKSPPPGLNLIDLANELPSFSDTAAAVENLDLIISVDTALIHLAGAMARPVWTLLHYAPDWRWMLDREDSPWYPTMRLFRQKTYGDWGEVMERVSEELRRVGDACVATTEGKGHAGMG
jgi:Flp pilus assembly protein TadD